MDKNGALQGSGLDDAHTMLSGFLVAYGDSAGDDVSSLDVRKQCLLALDALAEVWGDVATGDQA